VRSSRTAWIIAPIAVAAWVVLGHFYATSPRLGWLPDWVQVAAAVCPLAFVILYTVLGLTGGAKWWRTDMGTNFVWLELAVFTTAGSVAWAVLFAHGLINTPLRAWIYIGGSLAGAVIITWRSAIFLRAELWRRSSGTGDVHDRVAELEAEIASLRERLGEVNELNPHETEPCGR
jgi:hypothetical protein